MTSRSVLLVVLLVLIVAAISSCSSWSQCKSDLIMLPPFGYMTHNTCTGEIKDGIVPTAQKMLMLNIQLRSQGL